MSTVKTYNLATALLAVAIALIPILESAAQKRQPDFPYQALVLADSIPVHSGPGSVHYATDELQQDFSVEVHRHDPGGWCAIRPPAGSFSLVPETAVSRLSDSMGRITEDGIQAWVGTRLGSVDKPLWQVKLRRDEVVEILGEVSWPHPEGYSTIWYQISPPSGEFRWVRISDLRLPKHLNQLPEVAAADLIQPGTNAADRIATSLPDQTARSQLIQQSGFQQSDSEDVYGDPQFDDHEDPPLNLNPPSQIDETTNRGWRQATRPIRVADNRGEFSSNEPFKTPALDAPVIGAATSSADKSNATDLASASSRIQSTTNQTVPTELTSSIKPVVPISGPVSERIRKLESELTSQMQMPPAQWDLESLLRQSTAISSSTNDVREREHAQRLQQKIKNCVNIQSRYGQAFAGRSSPTPNPTKPESLSDVQLSTTYDAHGWLNQLVQKSGRMSPTYVLEDEHGKITHHIAPSPGLNLKRFVKQKVGVIGRRGFHQRLGLDHVTAERVVILNKFR